MPKTGIVYYLFTICDDKKCEKRVFCTRRWRKDKKTRKMRIGEGKKKRKTACKAAWIVLK